MTGGTSESQKARHEAQHHPVETFDLLDIEASSFGETGSAGKRPAIRGRR